MPLFTAAKRKVYPRTCMGSIQSSGYGALSGERIYLERKRLNRMFKGHERINAPDNTQAMCVFRQTQECHYLRPPKERCTPELAWAVAIDRSASTECSCGFHFTAVASVAEHVALS